MKKELFFLLNVFTVSNLYFRHAEVMKKIIETVAEGGGELGVHMYPFSLLHAICKDFFQCKELLLKGS